MIELFGGVPMASGIVVTPATAMRCTAVHCAVQAIAETIGQLPVHVYQRNGDAKERAPDHPVHRLVHDEANDFTPSSDFREQLTRDALLFGNGFAFVNRVEGKPVELLRLDPASIAVEAHPITGEPVYRRKGEPKGQLLARRDVLHLRAPSINGVSGESPVMLAREAIGVALTLEAHAARLFGRGARPSGVLRFPNKLNEDAARRISASWHAGHSGDASGRTAILEEGADFQALTFSSTDAQFLEMRTFSIVEIARAFRVPPIFLQEYGRATWGNSEEMGRQFLVYTLLPWIKRWEGEIRLKLFDVEERDEFFAEFLTDDLARADLATRMDAYGRAIAARILSPNEARAAENRPPYAGGDVFENPNTSTGAAVDV